MKLILQTRYASPTRSFAPGEEAEFDAKEAKALIDGGYAVPVEGKKKPAAPPAWRNTKVSGVFEAAIAKPLEEAKLATAGDVADYLEAGNKLVDVKGIGDDRAKQVEETLAELKK